MKNKGMRVVYDLDDALWSLPGFNPAQKKFNELKKGFYECAKASDIITVSTEPLKVSVRKNAGLPKDTKIRVVENTIDFDWFHPLPRIARDKFVIGWGGS